MRRERRLDLDERNYMRMCWHSVLVLDSLKERMSWVHNGFDIMFKIGRRTIDRQMNRQIVCLVLKQQQKTQTV